jgi:hypothetical protein
MLKENQGVKILSWVLSYVAVVYGLLYILTFGVSNYWLNLIVGFLSVGLIIALAFKLEDNEKKNKSG